MGTVNDARWRTLTPWMAMGLAVLVTVGLAIALFGSPEVDEKEMPDPRSSAQTTPADPAVALRTRLSEIFRIRADALVRQSAAALPALYDTAGGANQALGHEQGRVRYMNAWARRRSVRLTEAEARLLFQSVRIDADRASVALQQSASFAYVPLRGTATPHRFGIGTRHQLELVRRSGAWVIQKDQYTDPLAEDTLVSGVAPACSPPPAPGFVVTADDLPAAPAVARSDPYDRAGAVRYANTYCGAAAGCGNGQRYNARYRDLTDRGGDCTSFVSQALGDADGGRLPRTRSWFWDFQRGVGSPAWQQTAPFARFLTRSGYARLVAKGRYAEIVRPTRGSEHPTVSALRPGDVIGYEEKGRLEHFAIVVGWDNRGQPVVNSHTSDRYHVPWDLGWDEKTVYWLFALRG